MQIYGEKARLTSPKSMILDFSGSKSCQSMTERRRISGPPGEHFPAIPAKKRQGSQSKEFQLAGLLKRLGAPFNTKLAVNIVRVGFDGIEGNKQRIGDLLVGTPLTDMA